MSQLDIEDAIDQSRALTVREFAELHRVSRSTVYRAAERMLIKLSKDVPARVIGGELAMRMDEFERLLRDGPLQCVSPGVFGFDASKRVLAIVDRNARVHELQCPETRALVLHIAERIAGLDVARRSGAKEVARQA